MISTSIKQAMHRLSGGNGSNHKGTTTHQSQPSNTTKPEVNVSAHKPLSKQQEEGVESSQDEMFLRLRREAAEVVQREPILCMLLSKVGLLSTATLPLSNKNILYTEIIHNTKLEPASSFEEVISRIVAHRLSSCSGGSENICPKYLRHLLEQSFTDELEMGHTMSEAVREDAMAVLRRDPACETLLEAVLFMKGFHSLVIHRAARRAWKPAAEHPQCFEADSSSSSSSSSNGGVAVVEGDMEQAKMNNGENSDSNISVSGSRFVALLLQSQASSAFGVDIHPAASIGAGVMIDHASGVVVGETATIGDGTTILHGVTLGGTGKDHGDRHPKIGKDVLIGAGTKILGNITVGDRAKIGAGSVVLRPIPSGATAVGVPAKIIGYTPRGERPGSTVDINLVGVEPLFGKGKSSTSSDSITEGTTSSGDVTGTTEPTTDSSQTTKPAEEDDKKSVVKSEEEIDEAPDKDSLGSGDEESEDDDEVTDFGTPAKCRFVKVPKHNTDGLCPFSGSFRDISSTIRQECVSHTELRALLIQEGCTEGECVEVFFELLHCTPASSKARQCGCIPLDIFNKCFPEIAKEKTKLDEETIQALARGDLRTLGMSKKASRRFRSMFAVLGQKSAMALSSIPSSGSLSGRGGCSAIRKSEKERMTAHLDTTTYQEGITI